MLSSDWSRMDSCPASNTMYYNASGVQGEETVEGKGRRARKIKVKEQSWSQQLSAFKTDSDEETQQTKEERK